MAIYGRPQARLDINKKRVPTLSFVSWILLNIFEVKLTTKLRIDESPSFNFVKLFKYGIDNDRAQVSLVHAFYQCQNLHRKSVKARQPRVVEVLIISGLLSGTDQLNRFE